MNERPATKAVLFLDFDGTITSRDAIDLILMAYADKRWLVFEEEWRLGRMGSRDCLHAQMALVRASRQQLDALLDRIGIDEGFVGLLETCAASRILAHIISDGFDYCIRRILSRAGNRLASLMRGVRVCASHLEPEGHLWRTEFPFFHQACAHGCATCKPAVMRLLNRQCAPAIFVGDGLSDRYAAASADIVFAKNELAVYCHENSIEHIPYNNLGEVANHMEHLLASNLSLKRKRDSQASA